MSKVWLVTGSASGQYVLLFSSCVSSCNHFCTPYSSMSAKVWPSTPAAPPLALQHS